LIGRALPFGASPRPLRGERGPTRPRLPSTSTSCSTSSAGTSSAGWSPIARAPRSPSGSPAGNRPRAAHDSRRPRAGDDLEARGAAPGRPGHHQDPCPAPRLQRQPVLGGALQTLKYRPAFPERFGSVQDARASATSSSTGTRGTPSCRPRPADACRRASRPGCATRRHAGDPARDGLRGAPGTIPRWPAPPAGASCGSLDQSTQDPNDRGGVPHTYSRRLGEP
jgi:hypothetical protein